MVTQITQGISVSVEVFYLAHQSNPLASDFAFAYRVTIQNNGIYIVKLLRRHWRIADTNGEERRVEGEGVVGQQPLLEPNENYQYTSGCNLHSDMGKMSGTYTFINIENNELFEVQIPAFEMVVPFKMN
jgi:ApaG protein